MKLFIFSFLTFFFFAGCSKDTICSDLKEGTIIMSGSYCDWIIQLEDDNLVKPLNLEDFDFTPAEGQEILLSFQEKPTPSYCMMGITIEIDCIQLK